MFIVLPFIAAPATAAATTTISTLVCTIAIAKPVCTVAELVMLFEDYISTTSLGIVSALAKS